MILFIDTEWADPRGKELVSLALVSECGRHELYVERDPLPATCTDFVHAVVYPLLDRGTRAVSDAEFARRLHAFFAAVTAAARHGRVLVAFDHRNDLDLLQYALEGFNAPKPGKRLAFNAFNLGLLGTRYEKAVEDCFATDPVLRLRRHHALVDAWVNRNVYLQMRAKESAR